MSTFDENGLIVDTQSEIASNLEDAFKASFGDNIRVDVQSVFGQLIQNISLTLSEVNELVEHVAGQFDTQGASGVALSKLVLLNGIQRSQGTYSTCSVNMTTTAATTIPAGSLIKDAAEIQWATDTALVFASATTKSVGVTCTELGPIAASIGSLTAIVTPVYGWSAVTNAAEAVPGRLEETDAALRLRRQEVAERAATTSTSALYAAISDVSGVSSVGILVNNGTETDEFGIPPQHLWIFIGGVSSDNEQLVLGAIINHMSAGIGTYGDLYSYADPTTGMDFEVRFSEPVQKLITITVDYTDINSGLTGAEIVAALKAALVDYFEDFTIGEDVIYSRLYTPINTIPGIQIDDLTISIDGMYVLRTSIALAVNEIAYTTEAAITIIDSES
jgi:uncharacterized phage protein gp47/JayE